jgi:hypothetical protein
MHWAADRKVQSAEDGMIAHLRRVGKINDDADVELALRLAFRFGTVTGAQRHRAMLGISLAIGVLGVPIGFAMAIVMGLI